MASGYTSESTACETIREAHWVTNLVPTRPHWNQVAKTCPYEKIQMKIAQRTSSGAYRMFVYGVTDCVMFWGPPTLADLRYGQ